MKRLFLYSFFFLFFFSAVNKASADNEFEISTQSTFEVRENGDTDILQNIKITNKTEFTYTPSYSLTLGLQDVRDLDTFNSSGPLPNTLEDTEDGKRINISFPTKIVGLNKVNEFSIRFKTGEIAKQKGELWEVTIPGLSSPENFISYNIYLDVPKTFGPPSLTKPARNISELPYVFNRDEIGRSGIFIAFGSLQVYELNLTYTITNPKLVPVRTEIAIPPITSYQDVRINELDPSPTDVYRDSDGNWLATYDLLPGQTKKIRSKVFVKVYGKPTFDFTKPKDFLDEAEYWEVNDPEIKRLAAELKTP
jgi:hypothetical protein